MKIIRDTKRINRPVLASIATIVLFCTFFTPSFGQEKVCRQDTISIYIDEYRGQITWQQSVNGTDWTNIPEASGDTLKLIANDPFSVRLEVIEGECDPLYSDIMSFSVSDPPIVLFHPMDSTCVNERDFLLVGGSPEEGEYFGPGVIDGRFDPGTAGIGVHVLGYYFKDIETNCSETAFSQIKVLPVSSSAEAGFDMDSINTDTVQLQANNPQVGLGTWTITSGDGGSFSDIHDPNAWFYKESGDLDYILTWTINGYCGSDSDNVNLNFIQLGANSCPGAPTVVDMDGNIYKTVKVAKIKIPVTYKTSFHGKLKALSFCKLFLINGITTSWSFGFIPAGGGIA